MDGIILVSFPDKTHNTDSKFGNLSFFFNFSSIVKERHTDGQIEGQTDIKLICQV